MVNDLTVYQIFIGPIPERLNNYISSVREWAIKNSYNYHVIKEDADDMWCPVSLSNYLRAEYASRHSNILYVDWDIELYENFNLPTQNTHDSKNPDCLYYSIDKAFWEKLFNKMKIYYTSYPTAVYERSRLWKFLNQEKLNFFSEKNYKHHQGDSI